MTAERVQGGGRRRAYDPARRERIARAAIAVIAKHGVADLTHRKVAAEAGVPLGSTTYHFATLDDLLELALLRATQDNVAQVERWAAGLGGYPDIPSALADLVLESVTTQRDETIVGYALYTAALHRPSLRSASEAWDAELTRIFVGCTDETTGQLIAVAVCGLLVQLSLSESVPSREWLRSLFAKALAS
ncbi:TetR/AcrR family transcriptional regulator [Sciscionella sediminilitoris]|uniref:TetR/AcrR family transcriptional regulator n=1 Tax=Sciscionella sediminilitoris TaxID=1445613 RepID=UPI0006901BD4|nr:TetR family transcriptional regulator [Sciscionella sp. SE31]